MTRKILTKGRRTLAMLLTAAMVVANVGSVGGVAMAAGTGDAGAIVSEAKSGESGFAKIAAARTASPSNGTASSSNAVPPANENQQAEPFEIWFNPDGKTNVTAGEQGNPYVYSMSDMSAKTNSVTYEGTKYYTVQGKVNPKPTDGIPREGDAAMYVIAPEDGTITFYGKCASGKSFYMTVADSVEAETAGTRISENGDGSAMSRTVSVKKGQVVYTYCTGSKLEFAGFVFELPKVETVIPLTLSGESLGDATIIFSNGITDDVAVKEGDTKVSLLSGYEYKVTIDSALLVIDMESLDLNGEIPEEINIHVSQAPLHTVSGTIQGLPEQVTIESLSYTDEGKAVIQAQVQEDGSYTIQLKNGIYTASAKLSDDSYQVYDHVEVAGTQGEAIENDVWFYGAQTVYPTEYRAELTVGQSADCDYKTLTEAVAAAAAMTRSEDQNVTLLLCDEEYFEQVIINTPNITLKAAEGVTPSIRWYYGIGYKYYSIGNDGYYDLKAANDKFEKNFAVKWGAVVNVQSKAVGFSAEGIEFVNTFNQYVTEAEIEDGAEVITSEEYGQNVSGFIQERTSTDMDVANTKNVERAAALVCDADKAEFYQCTFLSSQDTLYTGTGRQYYRDCTIIGQTDYIFGNTGTNCIFDACELQWLGYTGGSSKAGYITATRGTYLFRGCTITANKAGNSRAADDYMVVEGYFGRPWGNTAAVSFIGTEIEPGTVHADGWYSMSGVTPEQANFREYGNYIRNEANPQDQSNFFYSSYAASNLAFRLSKTEAEAAMTPQAASSTLGDWTPVYLTKETFDLSGVDGWNDAKEEKVWKFTYFGTSVSSSVNTVEDGASIEDKVVLTSCSYNADGSINKKGGKFVSSDPADGISLYYTTIDPAKENFYLQADVTIDYMNPEPDGQEGFALMIRDLIAGPGEGGSFESNLVSVTATKLPSDAMNGTSEVKDMIGVRNYTGITNPSTIDGEVLKVYRQGFDENGTKVAAGETYRVSLEKTDNAYITSQYAINADGTTGEKIGEYVMYIPAKDNSAQTVTSYEELDDPMLVQDAKAYLGFAVARGMNATFSNIEFTTSDWKAEGWAPQASTLVEPDYQITSPQTCAESTYTLVFKANADGAAKIYQNKTLVDDNVVITANTEFSKVYEMADTTEFEVVFTPNPDYKPSAFEELSDYSTKTISKTVTVRVIGNGDTIYVASDGTADHNGTSYEDAVDLQTALDFASAGQTILMKPGTYNMSDKTLSVSRGRDGFEEKMITLTGDGGYATLDFGKSGSGLTVWGNYWHIQKVNITGTKDGVKGMQLAGSHCILERMNFYNNGNTGLQVSGLSAESRDKWPSYNTILNCTSMNNADAAMEDADGFAAKLTSGEGNVFDGCIAAYNADDGWDLFAKVATGSIGAVTIQNSVAYRNGYIMAPEGSSKANWSFSEVTCDENGTLTIDSSAKMMDAGNGNGFKMGGSNMPGNHQLKNSISYENKAKGFDSNSCSDIKIYDSTSYNNETYNVAIYTNDKSATTGYAASGILSFRKGTDVREQIALQGQNSTAVYGSNNYYWDTETKTSHNTAASPVTVSEDWFISLDTSVEPERNADGSINMHGLLLLSELGLAASDNRAGARGSVWGQEEAEKASIWVVGDSTVSGFTDSYYIPREGYGEELSNYLHADVYNLASSGTSSKDFTGKENYTTLLNGDEAKGIPAMGSVSDTKQFLVIGFGHNDEKTEEARYTNPNGDYRTEGSFANSLYTNYVKPALDAGVTPILCTPIVRLTDDNTEASYNSASGHITTTTVASGITFEGGDYAQAIRNMCSDLGIDCIDLTKETIALNVQLADGAQWMHSFTGAKYAEDGTTLVATGLDKTHTNSYGAKMNAWLIANADSALKAYSKGKVKPSYETDFADAVNPDYVVSDYKSPTETSALWPAFTDADGNVWYGSVFGSVGGQDKVTNGDFTASVGDGTITLGVANNRGKIASAEEGMMMYYMQLPAGTEFTLTAKATINSLAANNQVSFGLMARDDMYIDTNTKSMMGDYVAAGTRNQGAVNGFGRKSSALYDGPAASKVYGVGDTLDLKIVGTADGYTLTYGENEPVSAGFDYALTAVDSDYIYVGVYVVRNCNVTFSDLSLQVTEKPVEPEEPIEPEKPDMSKLSAAIESAEALEESDYTEESWKAVKEAIEAAKAVMESETATQEEVDSAAAKLSEAVSALEKKPEEPVEPEEPIEPEEPVEPENPVTPTEPSDSDDSDDSEDLDSYTENKTTESSGNADNDMIDGEWSFTRLESGRLLWSYQVDGSQVVDRWIYVKNPYKRENQPECGWFYIGADGVMQTGWFTDKDGHIYYLLPDTNGSQGLMLTGWQLINGTYYYFSEKKGTPFGSLLVDTTTPDGFYVGADGAWDGKY
ncbi:MAG: pectinesterase family protein [bacterium]|nr:pectinesterase family protein [bacterium]